MTRVAVVGNGGNGKTTLSLELGSILRLPVHHLDGLLWRPGWQRVQEEEFAAKHSALLRSDHWIIDGLGPWAYIEPRLRAADTVVFPDYGIARTLWWATKRQVRYGRSGRPELPSDCPEFEVTSRLYPLLWRIHREWRPRLIELVGSLGPGVAVHHLRHPREMHRFLRSLRAA